MKYLAFLLLLFCFSIVQAQFPVSPNAHTEGGLKTGQWTILYDSLWKPVTNPDSVHYYRLARFENDKPVGKVRDFYRSGLKQWDGYIVSMDPDVFEGEYHEYYQNGKLKSVGYHKNGVLDGPYKAYTSNGVLLSEGMYKHDKAQGRWLIYFDNGKLNADLVRKDGEEEGQKIVYYKSGQIQAKGMMKADKREGVWESFYENGKLKSRSAFANGEFNGFSEDYYEDGTLKEKGLCKDGYYTGYWIFYSPSGKKESEGNYTAPTGKNGLWKKYNEEGNLSSEFEMLNGKKQGVYTSFHPNGKVAAKGFYKDDHYTEIWTYYSEQGDVKSTGSYYDTDSATGKWIYYYTNGKTKTEGNYLKNKKDGLWIFYFESGEVELKEITVNAQLQGEWFQYYKNGKTLEHRNYDHGELHGSFALYHENGQLKNAGIFDHGIKTGTWMSYYAGGQVDEKVSYASGKRDGEFLSYHKNGKLFDGGVYDHGKKTGIWKKYYVNGQVSTQQEYADGKFTSVSYYQTGIKRSEYQGIGTGDDNKDEGIRREYFENGNKDSEGMKVNGLSEGKFIFYDSASGRKRSEGVFTHGKHDKVWRDYDGRGKLLATRIYSMDFLESPKNVGDSISTLIKLGDYDLATTQLTWLDKVLKRDAPKSDPAWLIPINLKGDIHAGRQEHDKALATFQVFATEAKRMLGDTSENYLTALNGIANAYSNLNRYEESLQINEQLIKAWRLREGDYSILLFNKAINLRDLHRLDEGETILKQEWERRVKVYGDSSVKSLKALHYLTKYQSEFQSNYDSALVGYQQLYKHSKVGGPYYLTTLQSASGVLRKLKRHEDAANVLKTALAYQVENQLDGSDDYFTNLISLSEIYTSLNDAENSRRVLREALETLQNSGKGETYHAAQMIYQMSVSVTNLGTDSKQAIQLAEKAKEILEKVGRQQSLLYGNVIDQLASCHYSDPLTYGEAEKYYKQALGISDRKYGATSISHYADMISLANYYEQGFKLERADSVFTVIGKDIYVNLDSTSILLPRYESYFGNLYLFRYQYTESIRHHQRAVDFYRPRVVKDYGKYTSAMMDVAYAYSISGNKQKAEALIREAATIYEKYGDVNTMDYLDIQDRLARVMEDQLFYKEAEVIFLRVIRSSAELLGEDAGKYRSALFRLGEMQIKMNEYHKADENLKKAAALSLKNSKGVPEENYYLTLAALAKVKIAERNFVAAENYFKQAWTAAQPYRNKVFYELFLQDYGRFSASMGSYAQSKELLEESLACVVTLVGEHHWFYAYIATDLGKTYLQLGENVKAEKVISEAMAIAENNKAEEETSYISTGRSLVQILTTMGRYEDAERMQTTILAFVEKQEGKHVRYGVELLDMASLYLDMRQYEKAKDLMKSSLAIFEEDLAPDDDNVLTAYNQLGLVLLKLNDLDGAQTCFQYCIDKRKANGKTNTASHAVALSNMGNTLMREGKFAESEKSYQAALALRAQLKLESNVEREVGVLDDFAVLYQSWDKDELAEKYWKEALQKMLTYIRTNFSFLSDYEKAKFWEKNKFDFESFNTFAVQRAEKNPLILGEMYNQRLATKGILLSASNKLRKRIYASRDSSLIRQYHQWTELREQVSKEYTLVASDKKTPHIDSLERSINSLEKELSISTDDSKSDRDQLLTWKDVQRSLAADEAAVEFVRFHYFDRTLTDSVVYAALVVTSETKTNPKLVVMGNGDFLETKAYRFYRNSIVAQLEDNQSYQNFWGPIESLVSKKKRVYLSLDGVFNQINLKTLQTPEGAFLMDARDFVIVSNTRDLVAMKSRKKIKLMETAALIGNPKFFIGGQSKTTMSVNREVNEDDRSGIAELPGTKVEIEAVSSMLGAGGWKVNALVQQEATEQHIKQLPASRVVHLATHGFFQDDKTESWSTADPMLRSGILLTGSANFMQSKQELDGENGILTAFEAANLSLDGTEMVVLSACETARGEIQQGEGVYGLQRAFITAGAESLVMSLWKVDDEATQQLMTLFYANWMKGMDKSEALNQAQRSLKIVYPHPYYWGAFVMIRG
jgi:antitoxin component YwqK of YwqJK toxin-antitoxin module/CHAT domain-containing protein